MIALALGFMVAAAHAEDEPDAPRRGGGAVRVGAGAGVSEVGASVRVGGQGEVWAMYRLGVGLRAGAGVDGLTTGRTVVFGEVVGPVRVLGGDDLAIVLTPGLGAAWLTAYTSQATLESGVTADTTAVGLTSSASLAAELYGSFGFLSFTAGPRVETFGFQTVAGTMNFGVGIGW